MPTPRARRSPSTRIASGPPWRPSWPRPARPRAGSYAQAHPDA
jgi:hypothetical protein